MHHDDDPMEAPAVNNISIQIKAVLVVDGMDLPYVAVIHDTVKQLVRDGKNILAIRLLRHEYPHLGLRDAKHLAEMFEQREVLSV